LAGAAAAARAAVQGQFHMPDPVLNACSDDRAGRQPDIQKCPRPELLLRARAIRGTRHASLPQSSRRSAAASTTMRAAPAPSLQMPSVQPIVVTVLLGRGHSLSDGLWTGAPLHPRSCGRLVPGHVQPVHVHRAAKLQDPQY